MNSVEEQFKSINISSSDENENIYLLSNDNKKYTISTVSGKQLALIHNIITEVKSSNEDPIPLPNVDGEILKLIIEFCDEYKNFTYEEDDEKTPELTKFDKDFFDKISIKTLIEVINASNYLEYLHLENKSCFFMASIIKGKSVEELRLILDLPDDLTDEDKEIIKKENEWLNNKSL